MKVLKNRAWSFFFLSWCRILIFLSLNFLELGPGPLLPKYYPKFKLQWLLEAHSEGGICNVMSSFILSPFVIYSEWENYLVWRENRTRAEDKISVTERLTEVWGNGESKRSAVRELDLKKASWFRNRDWMRGGKGRERERVNWVTAKGEKTVRCRDWMTWKGRETERERFK